MSQLYRVYRDEFSSDPSSTEADRFELGFVRARRARTALALLLAASGPIVAYVVLDPGPPGVAYGGWPVIAPLMPRTSAPARTDDDPVQDAGGSAIDASGPVAEPALETAAAPEVQPTVEPIDEPPSSRSRAGWMAEGHRLRRQGRSWRALLAFEQAAEQGRPRAEPFYQMGRAYLALNKPNAAVTQFQRALQVDANHAAARWNLNNTLQQLERDSEAGR